VPCNAKSEVLVEQVIIVQALTDVDISVTGTGMQGVTQAIEAEIVWSPTHNPRSSSVFTCFVSIVSNLWYMRDHRDVASRAHTVAIRQICQGAKFHLQEPSITSTKHISNRVIVP
jgi:hypothetical protein